ncbi:PXA-domain-containing protein [Martensiomyces pterosporus]|nr:PXA-domain-containing protein [Martensiomyces pterosporus]
MQPSPAHTSPPSTIAESLRSFWTSRQGSRRVNDAHEQLRRQLHRPPRSTVNRRRSSKIYVHSSSKVNSSISRLFSLIVRDFVQEWYQKVTDDKEFIGEVSHQLVLVVNEIERRCRKVDWVQFVLFECPEIIHLHIRDSHQCMARLGTVYAGRETSLEAIFQSMQPHAALTSAADSELSYLRHLAQELLAVFMPPESQPDEVVQHLLREILACAVLRNVVDAVSDPNTLNEAIIRGLGKYSKNEYFNQADMSRYVTQPMRIEDDSDGDKSGGSGGASGKRAAALAGQDPNAPGASVESMLREAQTTEINARNTLRKRSLSGASSPPHVPAPLATGNGFARAASPGSTGGGGDGSRTSAPVAPTKHATSPPPAEGNGSDNPTAATSNAASPQGLSEKLSSQLSFASRWLIRDLFSQARWQGWKNNTFRGLVYLHLILTQAFSRIFSVFSEYTFSLNQLWQAETIQASYRGAIEPILALANVLLWLDRYNHWVWAQFILYIFPLINILAGAAIDRTLVNVVGFLISEHQIASYVDLLVDNLWKPEEGGKFRAGSRPYKTLEQERMLKEDAAELVAELMPYVASRFFYGLAQKDRLLAAQRILEPFENRQLNKHLVYTALDSIVGKIVPELKSPQ